MPERGYIVGAGGAAADVHALSRYPIVPRDSNVGTVRFSPGGVTRNITENLARLGAETVLLSSVGGDAFGDMVLRACRESGIDVSRVRVSKTLPTACYIALMDGDGDMYAAVNDFSVFDGHMDTCFRENASLLENAAAVVTDANLTEPELRALLEICRDVPVYIDPVSAAKAERIAALAGSFQMIKPNRMELEALTGLPCRSREEIVRAAGTLLRRGCREVAVSLGAEGCYYADAEGRSFFASLGRAETMVDATGAGDAFTAGYIRCRTSGGTPEESVRYALAAGLIAVTGEGTIHKDMSEARVKEILRSRREEIKNGI